MQSIKSMLPLQKGDMLYINSLITDDKKPFMAVVIDYKQVDGSRPFPIIDKRFKHKHAGQEGFRRRKVKEHHITALHQGKTIQIVGVISRLNHIEVIRNE